jgi:sarcosine oxidase subunit beta
MVTTVFERGELGGGASGASASVVRSYFAHDAATSGDAVHALRAYRDFAQRPGADAGLHPLGFLVAVTRQAELEELQRDAVTQRAAGVPLEIVGPDEAVARNPLLAGARLAGAVWSPDACLIDVRAVVDGYAAAAERAGACVITDAPVVALDARRGSVVTEVGETTSKAIVCAAGPWSEAMAALAGVQLPLVARRTELLFTAPVDVSRAMPYTADASSGLRMRPLGDRLLVGMGRPRTGETRASWLTRVAAQLAATAPALAGVPLEHAWSGVWDGTPGGRAHVGHAPGTRFLYAAGFGGHGICVAPRIGERVRDLALAGPLAG